MKKVTARRTWCLIITLGILQCSFLYTVPDVHDVSPYPLFLSRAFAMMAHGCSTATTKAVSCLNPRNITTSVAVGFVLATAATIGCYQTWKQHQRIVAQAQAQARCDARRKKLIEKQMDEAFTYNDFSEELKSIQERIQMYEDALCEVKDHGIQVIRSTTNPYLKAVSHIRVILTHSFDPDKIYKSPQEITERGYLKDYSEDLKKYIEKTIENEKERLRSIATSPLLPSLNTLKREYELGDAEYKEKYKDMLIKQINYYRLRNPAWHLLEAITDDISERKFVALPHLEEYCAARKNNPFLSNRVPEELHKKIMTNGEFTSDERDALDAIGAQLKSESDLPPIFEET